MIAHVDLDSFFVAVERARNPALVGRAIVIGGRPASRGLVAAVSREARRAGIRPGMPLVQASARCPDLVFLDGAFDAYLAASFKVDEIVRHESPEIEWTSIDELYVRLAGDGVSALERIQQGLRSVGLDAACGLARSKVVAYIASRLARPRGVVYVLDGYEAPFLSPLKIEMLPGLDAAAAQRLRARGIRRLGDLAHLSPAEVAPLAGRAGPTLARQAAGIDATTVRRTMLPGSPLEDQELPEPTADAGLLRAAIDERVAHLARELRLRGVYARSLTVRVRYADGRSDSRTRPLREPSALTEMLQDTASALLAQLTRPERPVRAVAVSCSGLLDGPREPALFSVQR
jgi:nucleotidyltransferase/DNA polymerase involved in DNA repair